MSAAAPTPPAKLPDTEYRRLTDQLLAHIESTTDAWLQDDVVDIDTQRTGGLLELALPDGSKLIVNTQPPLQEIWLAARGGGFHFRWGGSQWVDTRSGAEFFAALSLHATAQAGKPLRFTPPAL